MPKQSFKKKGIATLYLNGEHVTSKVFTALRERKEIFEEFNRRIRPLKYYHEIYVHITYDNATINQFLTKKKHNDTRRKN